MIVTDRYTKVSNQFFELMPDMKGSVTKIMLAYFRASSGHHKDHAFMSFTDFQKSTGLKRNTVNTAIKDAVAGGYLAVDPERKGFNGKSCYVVGEKFLIDQDEDQSQNMTDSGKVIGNIEGEIGHKIEYTQGNQSQNMTDISEVKSNASDLISHKIELVNQIASHKIELENQIIGHKIEPHIKEIDFKETKTKEKNTLRDERGDFLLDDIFADAVEQSESNHASEAETETVEPTQQDETPYTVEELDYYKDLISLETLETHVYNPSHNVTQPRDSFRKPQKSLSDWQQLVAVVEHFFTVSSTGYATKIAQQIAGKAKSGLRHDFACSPPMNAVEACAFAYWLQEAEQLERLPEKAERLQERAMQFRALSNHFEHVNFARYILSDLLASQEPQEQLDPNSDLFKPAPKDVQDRAYAEAEALLGFSLSGEF